MIPTGSLDINPRPVSRKKPAMTLHAHVDRTATDCDGRMDQSYVATPNEVEQADEFGDISFQNRMVGEIVNTYSILATGSLEVTRLGDEPHDVMLEWSEQTEEGGVHAVVRFCKDDCEVDKRTQRDHNAEAMGY